MRRRVLLGLVAVAVQVAAAGRVGAAAAAAEPRRVLRAGPADYRPLLRRLRAGDTLRLAPGLYERGLPLHNLAGTAEAPIRIEAADPARPPVFVARPGANTASLLDVAWVELHALYFEGRSLRMDAIKAEGHAAFADFITIAGCRIKGHGGWQDVVGISTKCPARGWVVRGNVIEEAGTGMYFGQSDGSAPFVGALIEANHVIAPLGYGIQIKHQRARGGAAAPQTTVLRGNRLSKAANASRGPLARPNLLLGHFPLEGTGADDRYRVHGNLLYGNPSEALFQAEGNLDIYNNLLCNPEGDALRVIAHNARPRKVAVFHNTVVARGVGIEISGGEAGHERVAFANLVFADRPEVGEAAAANVALPFDRAAVDLVAPFAPAGERDFAPRLAQVWVEPPLPAALRELPAALLDFAGQPRTAPFAGACAPAGAGGARCA